MRGRKPKANSLKILEGAQPCRVNRSEPKPPRRRPPVPTDLSDEALAEWHRITDHLDALGVLTESDGYALSIYCDAFARKIEARAELAERGLVVESLMGAVKANPAFAIIKACDAIMIRVLSEFGLTPVARSRVSSQVEGPADEIDAFIKEMA